MLPTNIVIPQVNYSIGAVYKWSDGSTTPLTSCSNQSLVSALSAHDQARVAAARGVPSLRVRVRRAGTAPRLFVITGKSAAPDVIVVGPDRRAIRTKGPGFVEPGWIVEKNKKLKKTFVWAVDAPAGKWDFLAVPRSSRILKVQTARRHPDSGRDRGRHRRTQARICRSLPRGESRPRRHDHDRGDRRNRRDDSRRDSTRAERNHSLDAVGEAVPAGACAARRDQATSLGRIGGAAARGQPQEAQADHRQEQGRQAEGKPKPSKRKHR